jgi:hypothetical protein
MLGFPHRSKPDKLPLPLERLVRLRSAHAWLLVLFCLDLAAFGDVITGPQVWFGPIYLFVMCLAAWCLGWRAGLVTSLGSMVLTLRSTECHFIPMALSTCCGISPFASQHFSLLSPSLQAQEALTYANGG